jgi:hypothetical protein
MMWESTIKTYSQTQSLATFLKPLTFVHHAIDHEVTPSTMPNSGSRVYWTMRTIRLCLKPCIVVFCSISLLATVVSSFTVGPTTCSNGRMKRSSGVLSQQSVNVDGEVEQSLIDPKIHARSRKFLIHWKYV